MANPYHDENGMFCSKGEMGAAINRLATQNGPEAFDNYFKLRTEYENIEANKITVSKNFMETVNNSGLYVFRDKNITGDDVRSVYSTIDLNNTDTYRNASIVNLLENPNLPTDVKEDILRNAPVDLKREIAEKGASRNDLMLGSDLKKLVENETDNNLIENVIHTEKITFEDKYNVAQQSVKGLALLATSYPETFFAVPELEKELYVKAEKLSQEGNTKDAETYFRVLANHGKTQASHDLVIDRATFQVLYGQISDQKKRLAANTHISAETGLRLAKKVLKTNVIDFEETMDALTRNTDGEAGFMFRRAERRSDLEAERPYTTSPSAKLVADYERVTKLKAESDDRELTRKEIDDITNVDAHWNAHKENYVQLQSRYKKMNKRGAPLKNEFGETANYLNYTIQNVRKAIRGENFVKELKKLIDDER